jgi:serine/threonine protein kinase
MRFDKHYCRFVCIYSLHFNQYLCINFERVCVQIAMGVNHLHNQNIVHRDIKPHNILCAYPDLYQHPAVTATGASNSDPNAQANDPTTATNAHTLVHSITQLGDYVLKISDMGLSKQLSSHEDSFASLSMSLPSQRCYMSMNSRSSMGNSRSGTGDGIAGHGLGLGVEAGPVGTIGWQAPELIQQRHNMLPTPGLDDDTADDVLEDEVECGFDDSVGLVDDGSSSPKSAGSLTSSNVTIPSKSSANAHTSIVSKKSRRTQYVDVFSLGCVFHYLLVPGVHPFGPWVQREANIVNGNSDLSAIVGIPDAHDLISRMIEG